MASFNIFEITSPTTTGTKTYAHGLGEAPKALIFIVCADGATTSWTTDNAEMGYGCVGSSLGQWCGAMGVLEGASTAVRIFQNNSCIVILDATTSAVIGRATCTALGASTISLNWASTPGATTRIICHAIGGSDVNALAGSSTMPTSTGINTYSGVADGKALITWSGGAITTANTVTSNSGFALGFVDEDGTCRAKAVFIVGSSGDSAVINDTNAAMIGVGSTGSIVYEAAFVDYNPGGASTFRINFTTAPAGAYYFGYLVLGGTGINSQVGGYVPASSPETVSTPNTKPRIVLMQSVNYSTDDSSSTQTNIAYSVGGAEPLSETAGLVGIDTIDGFSTIGTRQIRGFASTNGIIIDLDTDGDNISDFSIESVASATSDLSFKTNKAGTGYLTYYLALGAPISTTHTFIDANALALAGSVAIYRIYTFADTQALALDGSVVLNGGVVTFQDANALQLDGSVSIGGALAEFSDSNILGVEGSVALSGGFDLVLKPYLKKVRVVTLVRFYNA